MIAPEPTVGSQTLSARMSSTDLSFQSSGGAPSAGPGVDKGLKGVAGDLVGQLLGGVLGAGVAAVRDLGHIDRPGCRTIGIPRTSSRSRLPYRFNLAKRPSSLSQAANRARRCSSSGSGQCSVDLARCSCRYLDKPGHERLFLFAPGLCLQFVQVDFWLFAGPADKAERDLFGPARRVVEEALVDMADLFDIQAPERLADGLR